MAALFRPGVQPIQIDMFKLDPANLTAALDVPVLVVQGDADLQIPTDPGKALAEANTRAKLVTIEEMSHTLKRVAGPGDQKAAYSDPKLPLAPRLVDALAEFLTRPPEKGR
jgi:pimeloyl-ACP methyl ester carboxylesterase